VPSAETQAVLEAIDAWVATLPPGTSRTRALPIPRDDEYGFEALVAIEPVNANACPIEIGVTVPAAGSAVALVLDTWGNVARRVNASLSADKAARVALFLEPVAMSVTHLLDACGAVAAGSVHLDAGLFRRRLVATRGWLDSRAGRIEMRGVEDYLLLFLRAMAAAGISRIETLRYEPWK
jgi:hypothetical protein